MRLSYPMRFIPEPGEPGVYNVQGVEPMGNIITYGEGLEHAKAMAKEALTGILETMLDNNIPIPKPPAAKGKQTHWIEPEPEVVAPILLKWAREDLHLTQGELANRLGITYQAVQKLERSGANPTIKTLAKVAKALGRELQVAI